MLAVLSALGYIVAFQYQVGYRTYFGLKDPYFLSIDTSKIITSIFIVGTIVFTTFVLYSLTFTLLNKFHQNVFIYIFLNRLLNWIFSISLLQIYIGFKYWSIGLSIFTLCAFYYYVIPVFPALYYGNISEYFHSLEERVNKYKRQNRESSFVASWKKSNFLKVFHTIFIFLLSFAVATAVGNYKAKNKESFLVVNINDKDYVVLDSFNNNIIIAPLDKNKNTFEKAYTVIEYKSKMEKPLNFREKHFKGGLKPRNKEMKNP